MAGVLEAVGYECAEDPSKADVLIYNTCSIREKAEVKVYSALGKQVIATGGNRLPRSCMQAFNVTSRLSNCCSAGACPQTSSGKLRQAGKVKYCDADHVCCLVASTFQLD